jgi:hypothetical protein
MGKRTIYQVRGSDERLFATLYSNSSHLTQAAVSVFKAALASQECSQGPNALVEKLLTLRYQITEGHHTAGDRIFWLVPADDVECNVHEAKITVAHLPLDNDKRTPAKAEIIGSWSVLTTEAES